MQRRSLDFRILLPHSAGFHFVLLNQYSLKRRPPMIRELSRPRLCLLHVKRKGQGVRK